MSSIKIDTERVSDLAIALAHHAAAFSDPVSLNADPHQSAVEAEIADWGREARQRRGLVRSDIEETVAGLGACATEYANLEADIAASCRAAGQGARVSAAASSGVTGDERRRLDSGGLPESERLEAQEKERRLSKARNTWGNVLDPAP